MVMATKWRKRKGKKEEKETKMCQFIISRYNTKGQQGKEKHQHGKKEWVATQVGNIALVRNLYN